MATVLLVEEMPGRSGSTSVTATETTSEYSRKFRVYFDVATATKAEAEEANDGTTAVPDIGDTSGEMELSSKQSEQLENDPKIWIVTCTYTIPTGNDEPEGSGGDGTKWNIKINGNAVPYEYERYVDFDLTKIANTAGELYPPQKFVAYDERLVITYDTANPNWSNIVGLCGKVNTAAITFNIAGLARTFPIGWMRYEHYDYSATVDATGAAALTISLHFLVRNDQFDRGLASWYPWKLVLENVGSYYLTAGGAKVPFIDSNNEVKQGLPHLLKANGQPLGVGDTPVFNQFKIYKTADLQPLFNGIGT